MSGLVQRKPDCAWCGASLYAGERLLGRTRCEACGAATTDPWPTDAELARAYGGWYRPETGRFSGIGDALLRRTRASLARRLDHIAPLGPVLDVGAGEGALLDALQMLGREAVGLERSSNRPDIQEGRLEDETATALAAVVFWHSLEHLPEPGKALETAAKILHQGGVLVIAIPNSDSLQARAFGDRWFALDLPRHLVHLTSGALLTRLRSNGLRVERVSYLRGGQAVFGWLHGLVGILPGHLNLYDAIRRPSARSRPLSTPARAATLLAAVIVLPIAVIATALEVLIRRGGTVYVEARCP